MKLQISSGSRYGDTEHQSNVRQVLGFTLIELLVTIAILGSLLTAATSRAKEKVRHNQKKSGNDCTRQKTSNINQTPQNNAILYIR